MPSPDDRLQRLLRLNAYCRWLVVAGLWLSVGGFSLWALRADLELWWAHFTWAAVRMALRAQPLPFFGLTLCVGVTLGVLVWHSGHILVGISKQEERSLLKQLAMINQWNPPHPLHPIKKFIFR